MEESKSLKGNQVFEILKSFQTSSIDGKISLVCGGKWRTAKISLSDIDTEKLDISIKNDVLLSNKCIKDMPVGVCFEVEHYKYLFETNIIRQNIEKNTIILVIPDKIEKIPRRNFVRIQIPSDLLVQVSFWHRGYNSDNLELTTPETNFWQGNLKNISVGGLLMDLDCKTKADFSSSQLIGLQFTAFPYEQPIVLEGLIRHIQHNSISGKTYLGVQFLGLETSWQGKEKIKTLQKVVNRYSISRK